MLGSQHGTRAGPQLGRRSPEPCFALPLSPWVLSFPSVSMSRRLSVLGPLVGLRSHRAKGPGTHGLFQVQLATLSPSPPGRICIPPSLAVCALSQMRETGHLLPATTCPLAPSSNLPLPSQGGPRKPGCWPIFQRLHGCHLLKPRKRAPGSQGKALLTI